MKKIWVLISCILAFEFDAHALELEAKIKTSKDSKVSVTYSSDVPTSQIMLYSSTNGERAKLWLFNDPAFVIESDDNHEVIRRKDGGAFKTVNFEFPSVTKLLPKQYPPILKYSDGSYLLYTGILHACISSCISPNTKKHAMSIKVPAEQTIWYLGKNRGQAFSWEAVGDGTMIFITKQRSMETNQTTFLDPALPPTILKTLEKELPELMTYFDTRFGKSDKNYNLFASFDPYVKWGSGYEGGTLRRQIFMHWYGNKWEKFIDKTTLRLFIAHELSHFYMGDNFSNNDKENQWIHEGAAELISIDALIHTNLISKADAEELVKQAHNDCTEFRQASAREKKSTKGLPSRMQYRCGLAYWANIEYQFSQSRLTFSSFLSSLIAKAERLGSMEKEAFFSILSSFINPKKTELSLLSLSDEAALLQQQPKSDLDKLRSTEPEFVHQQRRTEFLQN